MSNVFSPSELIGLFRAEREGCSLEESFSKSCSPRSYRLVERSERERCFGENDIRWYRIQKANTAFKVKTTY
ncbi:hypothetical protein HN51_050491 [Arachis hypogaea]|uniref:Uncharacterized protein n=1 Tax=Arachis hypogaea TaxID=3818 RepID=A0A444YB42_ARAHY|nr:hypothetical protein Ahy_B07g086983 [Arachis hypogaea]